MILREGALNVAADMMKVYKDAWSQCHQEPDQQKERMNQLFSAGGFSAWFSVMFGLENTLEEMLNEAMHTWGHAAHRAKEFADVGKMAVLCRNRGDRDKSDHYMFSEELAEIWIRTNHLLVTQCREVPKAMILQWLPSVSDLHDAMDVNAGAGAALGAMFGWREFLSCLVLSFSASGGGMYISGSEL